MQRTKERMKMNRKCSYMNNSNERILSYLFRTVVNEKKRYTLNFANDWMKWKLGECLFLHFAYALCEYCIDVLLSRLVLTWKKRRMCVVGFVLCVESTTTTTLLILLTMFLGIIFLSPKCKRSVWVWIGKQIQRFIEIRWFWKSSVVYW